MCRKTDLDKYLQIFCQNLSPETKWNIASQFIEIREENIFIKFMKRSYNLLPQTTCKAFVQLTPPPSSGS